MIDIGAYITDTNRAASAEQLIMIFERTLEKIGLDRFCYSLMTDHDSFGMKEGHAVAKNYPDDWIKYYAEKGYEDIDPVRKHVMVAPRPFLWKDMDRMCPYTKQERRLMHEAEDAKLYDGMGLSIYGPQGEVVGIGFASSAGGVELNTDTASIVHILAVQFHQVYGRLMQQRNGITRTVIRLSQREKEVLMWSARGKSKNDIGTILGISLHSVDTHFRNAFRKLDAHHKTVAVVKAISLGLITP